MSFVVFGLTGRRVAALLIGLLMMAGGCWLAYAALATSPVERHIVFVGIGVAITGALVVIPSELAAAFRTLVEALAPVLGTVRGAFTGAPPALPDLAVKDLPRAKAYVAEEDA